MNIKRIIGFVAFILAVILMGWALYFFIFRNLLPPNPITPDNNSSGNLPVVTPGRPSTGPGSTTTNPTGTLEQPDVIASGGQTVVSDYADIPMEAAEPVSQGVGFYNPDQSAFYTLYADNSVQKMVDESFHNVENIIWSPKHTSAVLEYPDGSNIVYDFAARKQITLPKELEKFSFDTSGSRLAAVWDGGDADNTWLMTGNADGSDLQIVEPVGNNKSDVQVSFSPDNQVVALYRQASDNGKQEIIPIGRNQENLKSFTVDGLKFQSKYAPSGQYLLYNVASAKDDYLPRLWITEGATDALGYSHTDLGLQTWADKCTFDLGGSSLYCAVPTDLQRGAGLFPDLAKNSTDVFYRVDIKTGVRVPIALPVGSQSAYTASNLFLSPDQSVLYFTDLTTKRLHSIRLK